MKYIEPRPRLSVFTCPHCQAISQQEWRVCGLDLQTYGQPQKTSSELVKAFQQDNNPLKVGKCAHCGKQTIWLNGLLLYPNTGHAPAANEDLSLDVKKLYAEAASIVRLSPRAAAALLRLDAVLPSAPWRWISSICRPMLRTGLRDVIGS